MPHPAERPAPDVAAIVCALARHEVDWVLTGSAVLVAYGADLRPGDLDVVVDPKPANLARLAALLVRIQAVPAYFRDWLDGPTLRQCLNWTPEPVSASRLDHRFVTDLGMLDLPPEMTGRYARLRPRATGVELAGHQLWLCDPTRCSPGSMAAHGRRVCAAHGSTRVCVPPCWTRRTREA